MLRFCRCCCLTSAKDHEDPAAVTGGNFLLKLYSSCIRCEMKWNWFASGKIGSFYTNPKNSEWERYNIKKNRIIIIHIRILFTITVKDHKSIRIDTILRVFSCKLDFQDLQRLTMIANFANVQQTFIIPLWQNRGQLPPHRQSSLFAPGRMSVDQHQTSVQLYFPDFSTKNAGLFFLFMNVLVGRSMETCFPWKLDCLFDLQDLDLKSCVELYIPSFPVSFVHRSGFALTVDPWLTRFTNTHIATTAIFRIIITKGCVISRNAWF